MALDASSQSSFPDPVRGLATVAMLKVNFDAHRDHIGMFEPFVMDSVSTLNQSDFSDDDLCRHLRARHHLRLPLSATRTLLMRMVQAGALRREGGRYFTNREISIDDIQELRAEAEARQKRLGHALREALEESPVRPATDEDALGMVLEFFSRYHVRLVQDEEVEVDEEVSPRAKETARFLRDALIADGEMAAVVQEMLEGFVLQNTLFLKDISSATRRFDNLQVFADSQLLFGAIGLRGAATETAARELFELLKETGAYLNVFRPTIQEMERVLAVYETKLATHEGRLSLFQTDMTRHLIALRATPSDIRTEIALLERNLKGLGITFRELPEHVEEWTLDEGALGKALSGERGENEPRVVHDVDCVAGVVTYRRGVKVDSLDRAGAVFATTSGVTARTVRKWYEKQGDGLGVAPIIHYLALSNLAWLKKPASASKLKTNELIALCTAALRPSRETWKCFVGELRRLEESGKVSSEEATAIVASELTESILVEEEIDDDVDSASMTEVVERVKASYREEADAKVRDAWVQADQATGELTRLRGRFVRSADAIAAVVTWGALAILMVSLAVGTALMIVSAASGDPVSIVGVALAVAPLALLSLVALFVDFHLMAVRKRCEKALASRLASRLLGRDDSRA